MKKLIALLLACMMVLGLVACGNAETPATTAAAGGETVPAMSYLVKGGDAQ